MPDSVPDPVAIHVLWQGEGRPYRIRLELPDGSTHAGTLDLDTLRARLGELEPVWLSADPSAYGQVLFEHLFSGAVGFQFAGALGAAGQRGIRLTLHLDEQAPALHTVPWERLYHPHGAGWVPLAAAPDVVFSRYLGAGTTWGLPLPAGPLRMLIVISSPYPRDHDLHVDVALERAAITEALDQFPGQIHPEFLDGPATLDAIAGRLDDGDGFDILHYTGHGVWKPDEQQAYLVLEQPANGGVRAQGVSETEIIDRFSLGQRLPRLIFLAACQSAQRSTGDAFVGLGPRLVVAGCPAVIAMQAQIEMVVARELVGRFYATLLDHGVVDLAVNRARGKVHERWAWEWAVPVLFMRLPNGLLFRPQERFRPAERRPYKGLAPYARDDSDLFHGRSREIAQVYGRIRAGAVTVVHGQAGVGLTSLMEAGVRPRLEQDGDLVVTVSEYTAPSTDRRGEPVEPSGHGLAGEFRSQLQARGLRLRVPGDAALPDLMRAASAEAFPRLVLVLDQFERAFELPATARDSICTALAGSLTAVGDFLRLVLVVHEDRLPQLSALQTSLAGLMQATVPVLPLDPPAAERALVEPLRVLNWPVTLVPQTLAHDLIVPDLAQLSDGAATVDAGHLQIVCDWLYHKALEPEAGRAITEALYLAEKSADGIMVHYLEDTLRTRLGGDRVLAERVLTAMASPGLARWVPAEQLPLDGGRPGRLVNVLETLVQADVLAQRSANGTPTYALANQTVAREARRLGGEEVERRYAAEAELERVWSAWLARDALATRGQLRYLVEAGTHLTPAPVRVLLLLRSAVARDTPAAPWLARLGTDEGRALIRQLEEPDVPDGGRPASRSILNKAALLLGLHDVTPPDRPENGRRPFGPVAWSAVSHPEAVPRRTAVLALAALDRYRALDRLDWALRAVDRGWQRRRRRVELRGTLAEADPEMAKLNTDLPLLDRAGVWGWRAWRRLVRDRHRMAGLAAGGAFGAGLGLGLLRAATAALTRMTVGLHLSVEFYLGAILGAALVLGMLVAQHLLLRSPGETAGAPSLWRSPLHPDRLPALLSIALGALFFGLAHIFVAFSTGRLSLAGKALTVEMGFVAGLGLSLALYGLPADGSERRQGVGRWLLRLGTAAVAFVLTHRVFLVAGFIDRSIPIIWAGQTYKSELERYANLRWWGEFMQRYPGQWFNLVAYLDAALVGIVLTAGIALGLRIAGTWLARWRSLVERAGD